MLLMFSSFAAHFYAWQTTAKCCVCSSNVHTWCYLGQDKVYKLQCVIYNKLRTKTLLLSQTVNWQHWLHTVLSLSRFPEDCTDCNICTKCSHETFSSNRSHFKTSGWKLSRWEICTNQNTFLSVFMVTWSQNMPSKSQQKTPRWQLY